MECVVQQKEKQIGALEAHAVHLMMASYAKTCSEIKQEEGTSELNEF
jgi:hypothetical protein